MTTIDEPGLTTLLAREAIRDLALRYCRAIDRKDIAQLRSLYTDDATDMHGDTYRGSAAGFCDFVAKSLQRVRYSGHHLCNHLVSVDGDRGEGEVYAIACHVLPDGKGGWVEEVLWVRYLDTYRRDGGGWRFASRDVTYDYRPVRPTEIADDAIPDPAADLSYTVLSSALFRRSA